MDLDMGEDKLPGDLLCCPLDCQGKKTYILGNNVFFASPGLESVSNNHTKIDQRLTRGRVFCRAIEALCWRHSEAIAEESLTFKSLKSKDNPLFSEWQSSELEGYQEASTGGHLFSQQISFKKSLILLRFWVLKRVRKETWAIG